MASTQQKRIWGWIAFDWAQQPFYTLGLTFVFSVYFAEVATNRFIAEGAIQDAADARANQLWFLGQTIAGLIIAFTAPVLGAMADNSGRKIPWIAFFSVIFIAASASLWGLAPDGAALYLMLAVFFVGFVASESALNFTNAILPSLGDETQVGRISGTGASIGYWGGVTSLFIMLLLFVESSATGLTFAGIPPIFGLDATQMQGTRFVGPFIALWYALFIIPFFLWVRDTPPPAQRSSAGSALRELGATLRSLKHRRSLLNFLLGSMFYRDALNALYAAGGIYAKLVLQWETMNIGIFGIISAITAAIATYIAGRADARFGPKPVIVTAILILVVVSTTIVMMDREAIYFVPIASGSRLPDILFLICGACIGGAGGALYTASRSMMVRHTDPSRPTEAFGLFALSGKATAFVAPALIALFSYLTGSVRLSYIPVIVLFILGLFLLRSVKATGDQGA